MKHAYLIIAHNEFVVLQKLIDSLDEERIDIYVLFDKKVKVLPTLISKKSVVTILKDRVRIYWGHYSQIEAEMLLFKAVAKQNYRYCHLVSGVHLPLYSPDFLYDYFEEKYPKQVFSPIEINSYEKYFKVKRRSYFIKYYRHPNALVSRMSQYAWVFFLRIQKIFKIQRDRYDDYLKYSNWVCITQSAVDDLVHKEEQINKDFKYTFCADEYFVPTVLKNSNEPFDFEVVDNLLYQKFENTRAKVLEINEFDSLIESKALFARKFSAHSLELVDKIIENYKNR